MALGPTEGFRIYGLILEVRVVKVERNRNSDSWCEQGFMTHVEQERTCTEVHFWFVPIYDKRQPGARWTLPGLIENMFASGRK